MKHRIRVTIHILGLCWGLAFGLVNAGTTLAQSNEADLANEYFLDGEYEKAILLYEKLLGKQPEHLPYIQRIVLSHIELESFAAAQDFLVKLEKKNKSQLLYPALRGLVEWANDDRPGAEARWRDLFKKQATSPEQFAALGSFLADAGQMELAIECYKQGRLVLKNPQLFGFELASLYRRQNDLENATLELAQRVLADPTLLTQMRNEILAMTSPETVKPIEKGLFKLLQPQPEHVGLNELLYDVFVQGKRFKDAVKQAKSLDRLRRENGQRLLTLALTLQVNAEYKLSNDLLTYLIDERPDSPYHLEAHQQRVKNFELQAFSQVPIDSAAVLAAVAGYDQLFAQFGRREALREALLRKAKLCIFYLNDLQQAESELQAIQNLALPLIEKAEANLLIGDIHVIRQAYFEAEKQYLQVDEAFAGSQVGAMAKFRLSQLDYYKGDFALAKERLGILKDNSSNDIANDAIRLYLTIQDNTGLDTSETALQLFAHAQLLIYQKRFPEAMTLLDSIRYEFPTHTLQDEILWEKAQIYLTQRDLETAMLLMEEILEKHPRDIWADDALFTLATLNHYTLKDTATAQKLYMRLLMDYPASLFKVQARERIRQLRGESGS
jgi:tetratricopeptide (TPR) repeat protein